MFGSGSGYLEDASGQLDAQGSSRAGSDFSQGSEECRERDVMTPATPRSLDMSREGSQFWKQSGGEASLTQQPETASTGREGKVSEVTMDVERVWGENMMYELAERGHSRAASEDETAVGR